MVEVSDLLPQDKILQQGRTPIAGFERILIVIDAHAVVCSEEFSATVLSILF